MPHWEVASTDEFAQGSISSHVDLLRDLGPNLGYPYSSDIAGSRHGNLRELRVQSRGRPFRVFYAFNPLRNAILLIGADKTGDKRFYERMIPIADRLYDQHLREIGDNNG